MKRLLFLLSLVAFSMPAWAAYSYYAPITVSHTMVSGSGSLTNFAVYVQLSGNSFKSAANGGRIQNSVTFNGQTVPADLVFSPNAAGATPYSFEIESWDPVNGIVNAWVLNSSLSNTTDWSFCAVYDNASVTTYQGGTKGAAWDSYYAVVWHHAAVSVNDSTAYGNNGTASGSPTAATGIVNGGVSLGTSTQAKVQDTSPGDLPSAWTTPFTIQGWWNNSAYVSTAILFGYGGNAPAGTQTYAAQRYAMENSSDYYWWGWGADWDTGIAIDADSVWHSWAFAWDASNLYFYRDGVLKATHSGAPGSTTAQVADITAGSRYEYGTASPSASLDENRISNGIARPAAWLATEFNNLKSLSTYVTVGSEAQVLIPSITSFSPASAVAGGSQFTLAVNGSLFTSDATVYWNSTALSTTYSSASVLTASVTSALIATQGTANITVKEANGTSPVATFTVYGPAISSFSPAVGIAGGPQFTLTVNGSNFVSSDVVYWNSTALSTTVVSSTQLTASVLSTLISSSGTASITVQGASGNSTASSYTISGPTLTSMTPTLAFSGGSQFTVTVNGSGFASSSVVYWGSTALSTTVVSGTQVTATVTAGLIASKGFGSITVVDSAGTSNALTVSVASSVPTMILTPSYLTTLQGRAASNTAEFQALVNSEYMFYSGSATPDLLPPVYASMEGMSDDSPGDRWMRPGTDTAWYQGTEAFGQGRNLIAAYLMLGDGTVNPSGWSYSWGGMSISPQQFGLLAGIQAIKLLNKFTPTIAHVTAATGSVPNTWGGIAWMPSLNPTWLTVGQNIQNTSVNIWGAVDTYAHDTVSSAQTNTGTNVLYTTQTTWYDGNSNHATFAVGDQVFIPNSTLNAYFPTGTTVTAVSPNTSITLSNNVTGNIPAGTVLVDIPAGGVCGTGTMHVKVGFNTSLPPSGTPVTITGVVGPLASLNGGTYYVSPNDNIGWAFAIDSDTHGTPVCAAPYQGKDYRGNTVGSGQNYNHNQNDDATFPDRSFMIGPAMMYDWLKPLSTESVATALNYLASQLAATPSVNGSVAGSSITSQFTAGGSAWNASTNPWTDSTATAPGNYPQAIPTAYSNLHDQVMDSLDAWTRGQILAYISAQDQGYYVDTTCNYHWGDYNGLAAAGIAAYYDDPRGPAWYDAWRNHMHLGSDQPYVARWFGANGNQMDSFNYVPTAVEDLAITMLSNLTAMGDDLVNNPTQPFSWILGLEYYKHNLEPTGKSQLQRGSQGGPVTPACPNCIAVPDGIQYLADVENAPLANQFRSFMAALHTAQGTTGDFLFWNPNGTQTSWNSEPTVLGNLNNPAGGYGHVYFRSDWTSGAVYGDFYDRPAVFDENNGHDPLDWAGSMTLIRGNNSLLVFPTNECNRSAPPTQSGAGAAMYNAAGTCAGVPGGYAAVFPNSSAAYYLPVQTVGTPAPIGTATVDSLTLTTSNSTASGSAVLNFSSTTGVSPGMIAIGTGIPAGDHVLTVTSTAVTLVSATTGVSNAASIVFATSIATSGYQSATLSGNATYGAPGDFFSGAGSIPLCTVGGSPWAVGTPYTATASSATLQVNLVSPATDGWGNGTPVLLSWGTPGAAPTYYLSGSSGATESVQRGWNPSSPNMNLYIIINWNATGCGANCATFGLYKAPTLRPTSGYATSGTALTFATTGSGAQMIQGGWCHYNGSFYHGGNFGVAGMHPAHIDLLENVTNYAYARGVGIETIYRGSPLIAGYQREVLYLKPELFLVYDRLLSNHLNSQAASITSSTDGTSSTPVILTFSGGHGFHTGAQITVTGCASALNGTYTVTNLDSHNLALNGTGTTGAASCTAGTATGNLWGGHAMPWKTGAKPVEVTTAGQQAAGMRQWYVEAPTVSIASISNTTPVTITTSTNHHLNTNFAVNISGVSSPCTALNGNWVVTVPSNSSGLTTFTMNGSSGCGAMGAGGSVQKFNGAITAIKPANAPAALQDIVLTANSSTTGAGIIYQLAVYDPRNCTTNSSWCSGSGVSSDSQNWLTAVDASLSAADTAALTPLTANNADVVQVGTTIVAGFQNAQIAAGNCINNTCTPPAPILPITYSFAQGAGTVNHYLAGLVPNTTYYVNTSTAGSVTISSTGSSGATAASANGVLSFPTQGGTATLVPTISGAFQHNGPIMVQ